VGGPRGRRPRARARGHPRRHPLPPSSQASIDLHSISVPAHFNEPLTEAQRHVEIFEHSALLDAAALLPPRSPARLLAVFGFAVSVVSTVRRTSKPFKDVMGGTVDLIAPDRRVRVLAEKVAHKPPAVAVIAQGAAWTFEAHDELHVEVTFSGIKLAPTGSLRLTFADGGEYRWNTPAFYVRDVMSGKLRLAHRGAFFAKCMATGDEVRATAVEAPGKAARAQAAAGGPPLMSELRGAYVAGPGRPPHEATVSGRFHGACVATTPDGASTTLYTAFPAHEGGGRWQFSAWATRLGGAPPGLVARVPPTDARLRADVALFELGCYGAADKEKAALEAAQRSARAAAPAAWATPQWFKPVPGTDVWGRPYTRWVYAGGYWEARAAGAWPAAVAARAAALAARPRPRRASRASWAGSRRASAAGSADSTPYTTPRG